MARLIGTITQLTHRTFEPDSDKLRKMNAQILTAIEFVQKNCCKWAAQGECLIYCLGAIACDTTDLTLVDADGKEIA